MKKQTKGPAIQKLKQINSQQFPLNYQNLYYQQKRKVTKLLEIQSIKDFTISNQENQKLMNSQKQYKERIKQLSNQLQDSRHMIEEIQTSLHNQASINQRKKLLQDKNKLILEQQNQLLIEQLQQKNKTIRLLKQNKYLYSKDANQVENDQQNIQANDLKIKKLQVLQRELVQLKCSKCQIQMLNQTLLKQTSEYQLQINQLNKQIQIISASSQIQLAFYRSNVQQLKTELQHQRNEKHRLKQSNSTLQNQQNSQYQESQKLKRQNQSLHRKVKAYQIQITELQNQQNYLFSELKKLKQQIQETNISKNNCFQQVKWYRKLLNQTKSNYINSQLQKQQISERLKKQNLAISKRTLHSLNHTSILNNSTRTFKNKLNESQIKSNLSSFQNQKSFHKQNQNTQNKSNSQQSKYNSQQSTYSKFSKINKKQNLSIYSSKTPKGKNKI